MLWSRAEWNHGGGGFRWCDKAEGIELGLGHDAAGRGVNKRDCWKTRFVFAFVASGTRNARCA